MEGDFVECGVNAGFMNSAIMQYLNWDSLGKTFYLLDTYKGIDKDCVSESELKDGILERNQRDIANGFYVTSVDGVIKNFSEWANIQIVEGSIPLTLSNIKSQSVAFVHIDLNCAPP